MPNVKISDLVTAVPVPTDVMELQHAGAGSSFKATVAEIGAVAAVPAGSDMQVQLNDGGAFGGDAGLTYSKTAKLLTVGPPAEDHRALLLKFAGGSNYMVRGGTGYTQIESCAGDGLPPFNDSYIYANTHTFYTGPSASFTALVLTADGVTNGIVNIPGLSASQLILTDASKNLVSAGAKPTITGSRGGNAALASLLTALATLGIITDGTGP